MYPYPVLLSSKVPEFTGEDYLADKIEELVLVVDILILFLDAAEYSSFPRIMAARKRTCPQKARKGVP